MDQNKARLLSGIFAVVDAGLPTPKKSAITAAKKWPPAPADDTASIYFFGEQYMESDYIETLMVRSAKYWVKTLTAVTDKEFAEKWPDMAALYDAA